MPHRTGLIAGLCALAAFALVAPRAHAAPLPDSSLKNLSATLRNMLVQAMPATLYEASPNWGHTAVVPSALKWRGLKPEIHRAARNDGTWRKIKITTRNLPSTLTFELRDWKYPDPDHMTFSAHLEFDVGVEFEQQIWNAGTRIYSGSTRARARVHLNLQCEVLLRMEAGKSVIPDLVFRLRVAKSDLRYDKLVVEHTAGIGGTGARVLGDAMQSHLRQWHPQVERDLIAKANAAIIRAADTREVRLSLGSLLNLKK